MSARPTDWHSVFGFGDPTPGDPWVIRRVSRTFDGLADDASAAKSSVGSLLGGDVIADWVGEAGDVFREKTSDLPEQLGKCARSYALASSALTSWATRLDIHQDDADRALVQGRQAQRDLESAESALSAAAGSDVLADYRRYQNNPPSDPSLAPTAADVSAAQRRLRTAQAAEDAAASRFEAAKQLALDAGNLRRADATTTAGRIYEASDAGIPERSRWDKFKDWAADAWDVVIEIAKVVVLVLGIVALIIGGPLAWVVLAAAILVLADTLAKYLQGKASGWDVLFAALGCIPGFRGLTTASKLLSVAKSGRAGLTAMTTALRSGLGRTTIVRFGTNVARFTTKRGVTRSFTAHLSEVSSIRRTTDVQTLVRSVGRLGSQGDHGGHFIAHRFLPVAARKNLFPQAGHFNLSAYKRMENEWATWIDEGMEVIVNGRAIPPGAIRPNNLHIVYQVMDPTTGVEAWKRSVGFVNQAGQTFERIPTADIQSIVKAMRG